MYIHEKVYSGGKKKLKVLLLIKSYVFVNINIIIDMRKKLL